MRGKALRACLKTPSGPFEFLNTLLVPKAAPGRRIPQGKEVASDDE